MEAYQQLPELAVFIDAGNNDQGGQVIWTANQPVQHTPTPFVTYEVQLHSMFDIYPELLEIDDENPGVSTSCADTTEDYPQAMMCNVRNADIIALIAHQLVSNGSIGYNWYRSQLSGVTQTDIDCHPVHTG